MLILPKTHTKQLLQDLMNLWLQILNKLLKRLLLKWEIKKNLDFKAEKVMKQIA